MPNNENWKQYSPFVSSLLDSFVPDHIRANYPKLLEFIAAYLDFLETTHESGYYQNAIPQQRDIDSQEEQFLRRIEKEIGLFVPREYKADPKLFYKKISDVWRSRGTEESIRTFFRLFFNEDIEISYPRERMLIPSNSNWVQEAFITLECQGGIAISPESVQLYRVVKNTEVPIAVTRFEQITSRVFRVYSDSNRFESIELDDEFVLYDSSTNEFLTYASVVSSPSDIKIRNGGADWQIGQVIVFPGTEKDTLIRVDEVDSNGSIEAVSVIQYGYEHNTSPTLLVSPYPSRPVGEGYDVISEPLPSGGIRYTLDVASEEVEVTDLSFGAISPGDYFLEYYVDVSYTGVTVYSSSTSVTNTTPDSFDYQPTDITLEEWLNSRATVTIQYDSKALLQGEWTDLSSIISNDFTRIQDSFYYQIFSYEISADLNPDDYENIVPEFNPAGQKVFFDYSQSVTFDTFVVDVDFTLPFIEIDFGDSITTNDPVAKDVTKRLVDAAVILEQIQSNLQKPFFDSVGTSDAPSLNPQKSVSDSVSTADDQLGSDVGKNFKGDYFAEGYVETDSIYTVTLTRVDAQDFNYLDAIKVLNDSSNLADSADILLNGTVVTTT